MTIEPSQHHDVMLRAGADIVSAGAIIGAFMGVLPAIAALGAIIWYVIQIWESRPVQTWWRLHRHKRRRHRTGRPVHEAKVVHHPRRRRKRERGEPQGV